MRKKQSLLLREALFYSVFVISDMLSELDFLRGQFGIDAPVSGSQDACSCYSASERCPGLP